MRMYLTCVVFQSSFSQLCAMSSKSSVSDKSPPRYASLTVSHTAYLLLACLGRRVCFRCRHRLFCSASLQSRTLSLATLLNAASHYSTSICITAHCQFSGNTRLESCTTPADQWLTYVTVRISHVMSVMLCRPDTCTYVHYAYTASGMTSARPAFPACISSQTLRF